MSVQEQNGQPPAAMQPSVPDPLAALWNAVEQCARAGAMATSENSDPDAAKKFGDAALSFAQAHVALDPTVISPQGVAPEVLRDAQPKPPAPAGRKVKVERDGAGNATSYNVEGGS